LRKPLEDKAVTISRVTTTLTFPANLMLVAAMNPCPCRYFGDLVKECTCSASMVSRYQKRISDPMLAEPSPIWPMVSGSKTHTVAEATSTVAARLSWIAPTGQGAVPSKQKEQPT